MKHLKLESISAIALTLSICGGSYQPASAAEPNNRTKPSGATKVSLTAKEKEMASKLGFDEEVLASIKEVLNPEMEVLSNCKEVDDGMVFGSSISSKGQKSILRGQEFMVAELLEKDRKTFEEIARNFPELIPLVDRAMINRTKVDPDKTPAELSEERIAKEMGAEKFARYKHFSEAVSADRQIINQEMGILKNPMKINKELFELMKAPDYGSGAAVEQKIKAIKDYTKGKTLKDENKPRPVLGLRYQAFNSLHHYEDDPRIQKLQQSLKSLGYGISEEERGGRSESKTFETKEEALKFLKERGSLNQRPNLIEQKAQKLEVTYPEEPKQKQSPSELIEKTRKSMPMMAQLDSATLEKLGAQMAKVMNVLHETVRLQPGTKVTKLGPNHWLFDTPARYEAIAQIKLATVIKIPKGDFGLDLVRAHGTNGLNYGIDNDMVVERLKKWNSQFGITVLDAGADRMTVAFQKLPDDLSELLTEKFLFDPETELSDDETRNASIMRDAARRLRETRQLSFWWD